MDASIVLSESCVAGEPDHGDGACHCATELTQNRRAQAVLPTVVDDKTAASRSEFRCLIFMLIVDTIA